MCLRPQHERLILIDNWKAELFTQYFERKFNTTNLFIQFLDKKFLSYFTADICKLSLSLSY